MTGSIGRRHIYLHILHLPQIQDIKLKKNKLNIPFLWDPMGYMIRYTLQEINISPPWEKENHRLKMDFSGDMLVPRRVG